MGAQASQPIPDEQEQQARSWLSSLLRGFLARLIVDVLVEFYARTKVDPAFQKRIADAFARLDAAQTPEENDAAALAIQSAIES